MEMDTAILNTLLLVCAETRQADKAVEMYRIARARGVQPDEVTLGAASIWQQL
jgi:pentatricopeptide repeat protein